jgi:proteasome lid subunit RPN8/RPN11
VLAGGTGGGRLRVPRPLYDGMIAHAAGAFPLEAVGLLGGAGGEVRHRLPLPNALGRNRFLADPYAQYQALRQLRAAGLEPLAVYHSHPGGGTRLSAEDIDFARRLPYLQLVIAIGRAHDPAVEVAAYAVTETSVEEVGLDVLAGGGG